jgi:hypothetical protein
MPDETKTPEPEEEQIENSEKPVDVEPEQILEEEQQPAVDQPDPEIPPVQPESALSVDGEPPSDPTFMNKMKRWATYALIGLVVVVLIFLAGFLTSYFVNARPAQALLAEQGEELSQIQLKLDSLESRNNELSASLSSEKTKVASLEGDIEKLGTVQKS